MTRRWMFAAVGLLAGSSLVLADPEGSERYYQAIRQNDLATLRVLVERGDVEKNDKHGSAPLFYAAAYGSLDAVRILIAAGAQVNAKNAFGATPLLVAVTEPEKVRFLIDHGADVNSPSQAGRTPLWIAAATNGASATVKLLLDRGANPTVRDQFQSTPLLAATAAGDEATVRLLLDRIVPVNDHDVFGVTPLMYAAMNGNLKVVQWLLIRGADVNAVSAPEVNQRVKNGAIALGSLTPLLLAAAASGPDVVRTLLDAGARIDAQDVRGMTPLMLAVATDHPSVATVQLLLQRGANPQIRDHEGQTAADWAGKYGATPILRALGVPPSKKSTRPGIFPTHERMPLDPDQAVSRAVNVLERTNASFFTEGGCISCHSQHLTALAVKEAGAHRVAVNEAARADRWKAAQALLGAAEQPLLQRMDPPVPDILTYGVLELALDGEPAGHTTDALVHNLIGQQRQAGNWHLGGITRAPMADGDISRTALAIRALQAYGPPGRSAGIQKGLKRAANWLTYAAPQTTEDWNMQALGLKWAGADWRELHESLRRLLQAQRDDGGWAQTPFLSSDAYATGQTLYTLHELGLPATDPAFRRGVQFLLGSQEADGSWHVKSRAPKIQPYFEGGFPYGPDQWISSAATAWAATSLSYAIGPEQLASLKP